MDEMEFHREIECLMRVKHKNVVRFLGYCANRQGTMATYDNKLVMADVHQRLLCFEYIPQGSLDKYIIDAHREWGTCYRIIKGICEGLQYLHENNIIHLDLKPANILLGNNMVPKITDFGLSRCFDQNQSRHITKTILGTLGYLAPELRDGGVIARSADLYSLGVIIIEILTGQKSYQDIADVLEIWSDRLERSRQDTLCEQIRVCYKIALECVDFSPKKRPASARNIIDRLHEMRSVQLDDLQDDVTRTPPPPPVVDLSTHSVQFPPSRERILKNALMCIKEDVAVGVIGIWGQDRDEKTYLLKKINDSFLGECPFDFVIFVTASSELSVQAQIISRLRRDTVPDVATQATRISELLKKKSFLLLVDDLRVQLDLQAVGIPHPLGDVEAVQRKVVVTSISQSICHLMDVERYIQVPDLEEYEARQLFTEEYGQQDPYSDPGIGALAEQLVRELKGLPSDLIRYGKVMQGIRDVRRWEGAIDAVRKANLQRDDPLNLAEKIVRSLKNATEDLDAKGNDVRREIVDAERQQRTPTNEGSVIEASAAELDDHNKIRRMRRALDSSDVELVKLMVMGEGLNLDEALALHYAVENCSREVVKALLELGAADVNHPAGPAGKTPLHVAAEMVCPDMVAVLLDHHADPNVRTVDGVTPLDILRTLTSDFLFKGAVPGLTHIEPNKLRLCLELVQSAAMVMSREDAAGNEQSTAMVMYSDHHPGGGGGGVYSGTGGTSTSMNLGLDNRMVYLNLGMDVMNHGDGGGNDGGSRSGQGGPSSLFSPHGFP